MPTDIHRVIELDSHPDGMTYIAWLKSGHRYATYDAFENITSVSIDMLINALNKCSTVQETKISKTPFRNWTIPSKALKIEAYGHADMYALPVTKSAILTALNDKSLGHNITTPEELQNAIKNGRSVEQVQIEDSPFKRNSSTDRVVMSPNK